MEYQENGVNVVTARTTAGAIITATKRPIWTAKETKGITVSKSSRPAGVTIPKRDTRNVFWNVGKKKTTEGKRPIHSRQTLLRILIAIFL